MEKCDRGVEIYKDNKVSEDYETEVKINSLGFLRKEANIKKMQEILMDTNYVDIQPDGKVLWKGRKNKDGYALINIKILPDIPEDFEGNYVVLGHRLVQELLNGGAPINAFVCHRSDIPYNLDPKDLFMGTAAQNSSIIPMHGRRIYPKGQDHWCSKLNERKVVQIVHLYYANIMTIRNIARKFRVCSHTISNLIHGRGPWAEISKVATAAALAARMSN